ncbi:amidase, partial [Clostridium sporogenes]|uniref:amidase n=1 Tax=Clostridium sporogenes TaxID=1509 RepID=UPI00313EEE9D
MDLTKLTAHQLKGMLSNKEVKAEEITKAFLDRINLVDNKLGAYLYVSEEEAIKKAKEIDGKIEKNEKLKVLSGIPVGIKDNINVKGMQNTCASKILEGYTSPYDSHVTEKIKKEDGIILGKLNMDEFAMGSSTENSAFKLAKNPWDLEIVPGGSPGRSAVAVAGCDATLPLGTDPGGSVREPASFCRIVRLTLT